MVAIVTNPEHKRTDKEDHSGKGIGEVKTDKLTESISYHWIKKIASTDLLRVGHTYLTNERANVDKEVVILFDNQG